MTKSETQLLEIMGHLGAALIQQSFSDDQIIMGHVRDANDIATKLYREIRATDTAHDGQVAENTKLRDLCERLKLEAKIHAGEARGANKTIREAYQAVTGCTGEPANWNGAGPIKKEISRLRAELAEAVELLHRMIQDFHPFTSKPMGAPYSPARLEQDRQIVTHSAARAFLAKQGE